MPKYQYKAKNMSGRIMEGVYDAPNQQAVVDMIRQKSFYVLDIEEVIERKNLNQFSLRSKISHKDIALFCRQFASILNAGVPLIQSLNMLSEQTENKEFRVVINDVSEEVQKGSSLSQAMSLHGNRFPSILIHMIAAGEISGTLDNALEVMAEHFEKEYKLQQKVRSAMIYPLVVSIVSVVVVWFLLANVVPMFIGMFESAEAELPLPTRVLISFSEFIQTHGLLLLMGIVIVAVLLKMYLSGEAGRLSFHRSLLTLPIIGKLQTRILAARFARTLSTLMATGVAITESLDITRKVLGNAYVSKGMFKVEEQVKQGKGLYQPMKSLGVFPPMIINMIMLGEETGTLDRMLGKAAEFYEEEVDRAVQNLTTMLEPAIIVVLGGIVGFIVLSIALPMFDMMNIAG